VSESKALGNGSFWSRAGWGAELRSETGTQHPLLKISMPVEAEMLPLAASQSLIIGDGIANNIECKYRLEGDVKAAKQKLDRELWVNSVSLSSLYTHISVLCHFCTQTQISCMRYLYIVERAAHKLLSDLHFLSALMKSANMLGEFSLLFDISYIFLRSA